jgi:CDP-diacylglycerol--inositol 3-phosphatidyltransferase
MNPIYLYYPNLVGYGRIVSTIIGFSLVFHSPLAAAIFYSLGQGFDAVDGVVARHFNQCSKFGALLDMLTDRLSTACLHVVLSLLYPAYWGAFASLITLDIVSHWCQMYSKLALGRTSHKGSRNPALHFYYTFPYALLLFCIGNELCFVMLYLLSFRWSPLWTAVWRYALYCSFPVCALKQLMNVIQLYDSCNEICEMDLPTQQPVTQPAVKQLGDR